MEIHRLLSIRWLATVLLAVFAANVVTQQTVHASLDVVDDFENYGIGNLNATPNPTGGVWTAMGGSSFVRIEQGGENQYIAYGWHNGFRGGYRDLGNHSLAAEATGTYFMHFRSKISSSDSSFGLTDIAVPGVFEDYRVQMAVIPDGANPGQLQLVARNGGSVTSLVTNLDVGVWYNLWLVVDNAANTYDVYFSADPLGTAALVGSGMQFRAATTNPLSTFMLLGRGAASGSGANDYGFHIDNIHYAAGTNLQPIAPPPLQPPLPGYVLVFEDEFLGTEVDTSKWRLSYPWGSGHTHNHDAYCIPEQVTVADGKLIITAEYSPNYQNTGYNYISGIINTHGRFHTTHGFIEARLKLPPGQGTWPAFWTLQDGWPPEIDIMEQLNNNNEFYTNYHWGPSWDQHSSSGQWIQRSNLMTQFNTYGLEWTASHLKWYFNGELVRTFTNSSAIAQSQNQYIILNLAVGGWPGTPNPADYPTTYEMDWVRVWKYEEPAPPEPPEDIDMYVNDIDMSYTVGGPWYRGTATVWVGEAGGDVSGATVSGSWSGSVSESQTGVTGATGEVMFTSPRNRNGGTFTFTVTDIAKDGYTYDPSQNIKTSGSITAP